MMRWLRVVLAVLALALGHSAAAAPRQRPVQMPAGGMVRALKITVLSTQLADRGLGEWGFAALVEADGRKLLYDTGADPDLVLKNARTLGIDLSGVDQVVVSHFHADHAGGLLPLRLELTGRNPRALAWLHVGKGIAAPRHDADGNPRNDFPATLAAYLATGARVTEHEGPAEIVPGIWITGPVPRHHEENNISPGLFVEGEEGRVPDTVLEDSALVIRTPQGLVILTGCAHAGIMNIADFAQLVGRGGPILAVVGGLHLFDKGEAVLAETAERLKGIRYLLAAHCTGVEATLRLRELLGLDRHTAVVAATGSSFTLGQGIDALRIAGWPEP